MWENALAWRMQRQVFIEQWAQLYKNEVHISILELFYMYFLEIVMCLVYVSVNVHRN